MKEEPLNIHSVAGSAGGQMSLLRLTGQPVEHFYFTFITESTKARISYSCKCTILCYFWKKLKVLEMHVKIWLWLTDYQLTQLVTGYCPRPAFSRVSFATKNIADNTHEEMINLGFVICI